MDLSGILPWVMSHLVEIGSIVGSLIVIDEVVLKIWPSPTQSSLAYRVKEILTGVLKFIQSIAGTLLPSTKE